MSSDTHPSEREGAPLVAKTTATPSLPFSHILVTGLMQCLALEYQRRGVQSGLFHFGGIDTPLWDNLDMNPSPDKMISPVTAAQAILQASRS